MQQPQENEPDNVAALKKLHYLTILVYWAGFPFFLSHGILSRCLFPALSLIPMTASGLFAIYRLFRLRKKDGQYQILLGENEQPKGSKEDFLLALVDIVIVVLDVFAFVGTCIFTYARSYGGRFQALAAYGTVMLFVDVAIHIILLRKSVPKMFGRKHDCAANCPNCRGSREVAGASEDRYSDVVEVSAPPREGGSRA